MPRRVVVVGGGIGGLSAAHRLLELDARIDVMLLEATDRVGGVVSTELVDGFVIEHGPDSILTEKPWALDLARRLGLEADLVRTQDGPTGAYVVHRGRLARVPDGFALMAPTQALPLLRSPVLTFGAKLRAAMDLFLPRQPERPDESLASFVSRRFGREVLERLAQPMVGGIYGVDPEELSLRATFPRFLDAEKESRSVILGLLRRQKRAKETAPTGARYGMFVSFRRGNQTLTDALAARLGGRVVLDTRVRHVERRGSGFAVHRHEGDPVYADGVIIAVAACHAARLVEAMDGDLAYRLDQIPYNSSATVTLAWPRRSIPYPLDAFGFVVPDVEGRSIVASTWSSEKYPNRAPADMALLRVFLGGPRNQMAAEQVDEEIVATARGELRELMGIEAAPSLTRVHRHRRALPQYRVGHLDRVAEIEARLLAHPGLVLAGNAYRGVGIPDVVRSGEVAAEEVLRAL
jgi:oxygen-dependent protoporphyrinogen oxidase